MLTRARSLLSRVFSFDTSASQERRDEAFDDINDGSSDEGEFENAIYPSPFNTTTTGIQFDNYDDGISNDDDQSLHGSSSTRSQYEKQINDYGKVSIKANSNPSYIRAHEQTRHSRLINAMQMATSRCNIEAMKRLLNCFDIDINHRDQLSMTYLEHAIHIGSFDMVDLLIRYGCDLYQGNSKGHSYLFIAIEVTTHKSLKIVRLLLESQCSCLRLMDIISLTSSREILYVNCQSFLLLNTYLLLILKYHIRRMVLNDVLNLIHYLIITNSLLCKNEEYYRLNPSAKTVLPDFNASYISLFVKALGARHILKLEQKLRNFQAYSSSSLTTLTLDDIQPYINQLQILTKQLPDLKHLCRLCIRQNLKDLKGSTLTAIMPTIKLREYLLYTPI